MYVNNYTVKSSTSMHECLTLRCYTRPQGQHEPVKHGEYLYTFSIIILFLGRDDYEDPNLRLSLPLNGDVIYCIFSFIMFIIQEFNYKGKNRGYEYILLRSVILLRVSFRCCPFYSEDLLGACLHFHSVSPLVPV